MRKCWKARLTTFNCRCDSDSRKKTPFLVFLELNRATVSSLGCLSQQFLPPRMHAPLDVSNAEHTAHHGHARSMHYGVWFMAVFFGTDRVLPFPSPSRLQRAATAVLFTAPFIGVFSCKAIGTNAKCQSDFSRRLVNARGFHDQFSWVFYS